MALRTDDNNNKRTENNKTYKYRILSRKMLLLYVILGALLIVGSDSKNRGTNTAYLAAQTADVLRKIAGDQFVADLEALVYGTSDIITQISYRMGFVKPESPWQIQNNIPAIVEVLPFTPIPTIEQQIASIVTTIPTSIVSTPAPIVAQAPTNQPIITTPTRRPDVSSTAVTRSETPIRQNTAIPTRLQVTSTPVSIPPTSTPVRFVTTTPLSLPTPAIANRSGTSAPDPTSIPVATAPPNASHTNGWQPKAVKPFTNRAGEGQWQPYIADGSGNIVAYRTFLAPDKQRPYVTVGVVSFDLRRVKLGFVLGNDEPRSNVKIQRSGRIPANDMQAGKLLAVFNGGFKAQHGNFGVMAEGMILIPPRDTFATAAIRQSGQVSIGAWGRDIRPSSDIVAWRQNGPLILENGTINPLTEVMTAANWGAALDGTVAVWRSAMGINRDGTELYYAAGNQIVMQTMANAMLAVGADDAMQLDINNYWVHFSVVKWENGSPIPDPLFNEMRAQDPRRYLGAYSRDYFYVAMK